MKKELEVECHAIQRNVEANNILCIYGWAMSQKLSVNDFKWKTNMSIFDVEFRRNYDEDSDKGYILEVIIDYPKDLHDLHINLPFLPERMEINKCNELVCNLYSKNIMLVT